MYRGRKGKSVNQLVRISSKKPAAIRRRVDVSKAPSPYKADPFQNRKFRFTNKNSSPSAFSITRGDLLNLYTFQFTTGTNLYSNFQSIRLRRVQVWGIPPSNSSTFLPVALTWKSFASPDVELSTSGTQMTPAYITTVPPKDSFAGTWTSFDGTNSTEVLFILSLQGGEMIDIEVEYVPASGVSPFLTTVTARVQTGYSFNFLDFNSSPPMLAPVSNLQLT